MSHLTLWVAPSFGLCLLVCSLKLCIYSFAMGTSIAKQLQQAFIVMLKETLAPAEHSFFPVPYLFSSLVLAWKRRVHVVPVVW